MQTYYTTSTAPGFSWSFVDQAGNALNVSSATFKITYRCTKNFLKTLGAGSWGTPNGNQVAYTLGATDMANAYALYSPLIGSTLFEVYATAIISGQEYDASPIVIEIAKI